MKAIQKLNKFKNNARRITNLVFRGLSGAYERGGRSASPVTTGASDSASKKHLNGDSSCVTHFVLRHVFLLSLFKKISYKLPWRSRTNNNYIKNFRRLRILGVGSSFSLGLLLLATFVPLYNVTRTEDTEAAAGTAQDSEITFTATRSTASVDLTVTSENGTFASSTDGTNGTTDTRAAFSLSTTNFTGYTLTIASNNDTSALTTNDSGSISSSLSSISSPIDESTFNTAAYNNKWGYKPNYYGSSANSNYLPSPTPAASTLDETTSANSTAKNYTIALGVRADYTKASGIYSSSNYNNYKLMYVANSVPYTISYNKNTTDDVANMPNTQSGSVSETTTTLSEAVPVRNGYGFKGWCTVQVSDGSSCTGTTYNPNGDGTNLTYGINRTASNSATLYAMWSNEEIIITVNFSSSEVDYVTFSDISNRHVSIFESGGVRLRPNESYTISVGCAHANECEFISWTVTDNITINDPNSSSASIIVNGAGTLTLSTRKLWFQNATSADCGKTMYDNRGDSNYKKIAYSTAKIRDLCWMTRNLDLPGGTTLTSSDSNVTSDYTLPASSTSGFDNYEAFVYNSGRTTCSSDSSTGSCYSYYSYAAATAGTNPSSGAASSDICPKGWRLPTRTEYEALRNSYHYAYTNGALLTTSPFHGVYSGDYQYGYFAFGGSVGSYWSSTVDNAEKAYNLSFDSSSADNYSEFKNFGYAVRCVMTPPPTMQEVDSTKLATLMPNVGDTATLMDSRDGEEYLIGRLEDGNYWMLDNLRLGVTELTTDLASNNTNLTETISASDWNSYNTTDDFYSYTAPMFNNASADTTVTSYGRGSGKVGVYYNYCAASAGTICAAKGVSTSNASYDICPKGWRMPTGGDSSEYQALQAAYSDNAEFMEALSTPLSGFYISDSADWQEHSGHFWSSTSSPSGDGSAMHYLYVAHDDGPWDVYPTYAHYRRYGYSVRCIKDKNTKIHLWYYGYFQDVNSGSGWWTPVGDEEVDMSDPIAINTSYIPTSIDPSSIYHDSYWEFDGYCVTPGSDIINDDPAPSDCSGVYVSAGDVPTFESSGNIDSEGNTAIRGLYRSEWNSYYSEYIQCTERGGTWNGSSCEESPEYTQCMEVGGNWNGASCEGLEEITQCWDNGGTWNGTFCEGGTQYEEQQCMEGGGNWMGDYCEYGGGDPSFYGTFEECENNGYHWDWDMGTCQW